VREHKTHRKVALSTLNLLSRPEQSEMSIQAEGTALSALEREAEHTRADLIHTVDELHSRVSPQAIKEEVKAYARETGSDSKQFRRR